MSSDRGLPASNSRPSIQASAAEMSSIVARKVRVWPSALAIASNSTALRGFERGHRLGIGSYDRQQIGEARGSQHLSYHLGRVEQNQQSIAPGQGLGGRDQ